MYLSETCHFIGLNVSTYFFVILLNCAILRSESKIDLLLVETTIPIKGLVIGLEFALYL